jgi:hypothetical protein
MRTLRLSLERAVILALAGGLSAVAAIAQDLEPLGYAPVETGSMVKARTRTIENEATDKAISDALGSP